MVDKLSGPFLTNPLKKAKSQAALDGVVSLRSSRPWHLLNVFGVPYIYTWVWLQNRGPKWNLSKWTDSSRWCNAGVVFSFRPTRPLARLTALMNATAAVSPKKGIHPASVFVTGEPRSGSAWHPPVHWLINHGLSRTPG